MDDFLKLWAVLGPALTAMIAWGLNRYATLKWERHVRKEERYKALLKLLTGFYVPIDPKDAHAAREQKTLFLQEWRLAWLDCPDSVIQCGDHFLSLVRTGETHSDEIKEDAVASLVAEMRKDLFRRTKLTAKDYRHWAST